MDSYQPPTPTEPNSNGVSSKTVTQQPEPMLGAQESSIGFLDVYIHQARDIHNICIYHKQDVYAKICLSSDPEVSLSTKIINGGGKNPVFNENLQLKVHNIDSSLKCEIWMLSRVKNYLEDQLLGFALVPLSEIVAGNGKLTQEFSLSSTDLFHSPAGFVQLSLSYVGSSPEVIPITALASSAVIDTPVLDSETDDSIPCEYVKIEFPDLKVVNENQKMVSEYFGIPCDNLESQCSENLEASQNGDDADCDAGVRVVESFSADNADTNGVPKIGTPPSDVSTNSSPATVPVTSESVSDLSGVTDSPKLKEKGTEIADGEVESSKGTEPIAAFTLPVININIEQEQTVVQQDIVNMYMKSMQQSLAKMKLPMDIENNGNNVENAKSDSEQKVQASKGTSSRVFYGSRAFF